MTERATIVNLKRFAVHDGAGIRTVLILKGCPLHCSWCHNPETISTGAELAFYAHKCVNCGECVKVCPKGAQSIFEGVRAFDRKACVACGKCTETCPTEALLLYGKTITVDEALKEVLKDKIFYEQSGGGVTLSGGEPLLQPKFALAFLQACKRAGLNTAVDTSGFLSREILAQVAPFVDEFLYDMKAMDDPVHRKHTGQSNEVILSNLKYLINLGAKIEIRIPLIPDVNDGEENVSAVGRWLKEACFQGRVRLLPFNSYAVGKYTALGKEYAHDCQRQTEEFVENLAKILQSFGVRTIS